MLSTNIEDSTRPTRDHLTDSVYLSERAKQQLFEAQSSGNTQGKEKNKEEGKESVQVSSSIGRLSRISGLQREEVAALYRSIDRLTDK